MTSNEEFDEIELQALRAAAEALPREIAPNAAAWSNIRERIEQTRVRELVPVAPRISRSWIRSTRGAVLVAASLFLVVTTVVVRQQGSIETVPSSPYAADTGRTDMAGVFARYDGAATDLVNDLERRRTLLNPAAVAVLDSALFTIDEAIRETRDALKDAPDNATIAGLLEVTYQQKLDLLRRASELSEGSFQE